MPTRWITFAAILLAMPLGAVADACVSGSLESYINLPQGCTIGDKVFGGFGFHLDKGQLAPLRIFVTPDTKPGDPGLVFSSGSIDTSFLSTIAFDLSYTVVVQPGGNLIEDNDLSLDKAGTQGNGSVEITETKCLGAAFTSGGCPTGKTVKLEVMTGAFGNVPNAHATFSPSPPSASKNISWWTLLGTAILLSCRSSASTTLKFRNLEARRRLSLH